MSELGKAVFLSYASQDADVARKICETLRATGVEVWFDQSELRGGDAWDQKIRRQIKECALFVPIISANTQARTEGYFRREWRWAVERMHDMDDDLPFLVPVVIDDTRDAEAFVPDRFRERQWIRIGSADSLDAFCERVGGLLGGGSGSSQAPDQLSAGSERRETRARSVTGRSVRRFPSWLAFAALGLGVIALGLWRPWQPRSGGPGSPSATAPRSPEARQLVERAMAITVRLGFSRDDLAAAEDMAKRATELEPDWAQAWAARAWTNAAQILRNWDREPKRRQATETLARRALALDSDEPDALNAMAQVLLAQGAATQAEELARRAVRLRPDNGISHRLLAAALGAQNRVDEMRAVLNARLQRDPTDVLARYNLAGSTRLPEELALALEQLDAALATVPFAGALHMKARLLAAWRGDLLGMRKILDELEKQPAFERSDDQALFAAMWGGLLERKPERALAAAALTSRPYLEHIAVASPRPWYTALAREIAGQPGLARIEWQAAETVLRDRLRDRPDALVEQVQLASTLAWLGKTDEASRLAAPLESVARESSDSLDRELVLGRGDARGRLNLELAMYYGASGDAAGAAPFLRRALNRAGRVTDHTLPLDPWWDKLRGQPEFDALLAEGEARMAAERTRISSAAQPSTEFAAANSAAKSVAVLAFANLSDEKENEYFSDGISEELLNVLGRVPGLRVAARTSAFYFKNQKATAQEIGQKLGVEHLVEGSVRRAGTRVRIAARLSRADTGEQLWSETYDRELTDVFAVQTELAQTILGQLHGQLGGTAAKAEIEAQVRAAEIGGTRESGAHQLYLQGRFFLNQFSVESAERAAQLLRQAVESDPRFALAWASLARAGWLRSSYGDTRQRFEEGIKLAREAAERALQLAPDLADAHLARFDVQSGSDFDWKGAIESVRRALALAPNDSAAVLSASVLAYMLGQGSRAVELAREAVSLDPVNPRLRVHYAWCLGHARRFDESDTEFRRASELSPAAPWGHAGIAVNHVLQGQFDAAETEVAQEKAEWARLLALALVQSGRGQIAEADKTVARFVASYAEIGAFQIAQVFAFRRENDRAFEWLERALRQRDSGLGYSKADLLLEPLHADPRWPEFLKKIGLADEQLK